MQSNSTTRTLRILLVDDDIDRAELVAATLRQAGFINLHLVQQQQGLLRQIEQVPQDVILISVKSPGRDLLQTLSVVSNRNPTPIVMFTEEDDPCFIIQAVDAGVTSYLVDGIRAEKVEPMVEVALAQFRARQRLTGQISETASSERQIIRRAKLLLVARDGLTEPKAHQVLQKLATTRNLRLAELAAQMIELAEQRGETAT
jgi:response regulator NasT